VLTLNPCSTGGSTHESGFLGHLGPDPLDDRLGNAPRRPGAARIHPGRRARPRARALGRPARRLHRLRRLSPGHPGRPEPGQRRRPDDAGHRGRWAADGHRRRRRPRPARLRRRGRGHGRRRRERAAAVGARSRTSYGAGRGQHHARPGRPGPPAHRREPARWRHCRGHRGAPGRGRCGARPGPGRARGRCRRLTARRRLCRGGRAPARARRPPGVVVAARRAVLRRAPPGCRPRRARRGRDRGHRRVGCWSSRPSWSARCWSPAPS